MKQNDTATFEGKTVCWTPEMLARFKVFIKRTPANATTFTFDGNLFDKGYAKYLAEYLDSIFARKNGQGAN
jgi:hypothetical protein